jgi:HEAT repeat protein
MNDARAVPPLIDALEDEDWQVRLAATVALGELGDLSAYKPLCSMLKDDHWKVCADAAKSIGRLKVPESIVILMKLTKDPQPEVRAAAVYGLGNLGDPQAVKPVIGGLKDPHEYMRQACASVLGDLGSHRAVDPLCETLKDLNDDVRAQAAGSLGKLKDRRAFKPLVEALNDWYSGVCSASAQSLLLLGPPEDLWGYAWLMGGSEDDTEKEKAIGHIRDAGEGALQALLDCLSDWHNSVRCAAATALGELKHSSAVQPLCAEATKSPLNDEVINYMFQALAAIKQPGTGVLLSQALDNAMFQSEDLPLVKKLLNYTRQLSKASWMTELDKKGVVEIHEKLLKR